MTIVLIFTILHFYEYGELSFLHDDIDLSSLHLIVALDDLISFTLEIFHGNILTIISDGTV